MLKQLGNEKLKPAELDAAAAQEYIKATTLSAHDPKSAQPLNDSYWDAYFNPYRSQDATLLSLTKSGEKIPLGIDTAGKAVTADLTNNSYVKVLETVAATMPPGTPEFRGEDRTNAVKALAELVRTRKLSVQQAAADLVGYTKVAAAYNQTSLKLATLNIPVQESAYVSIPGHSFTSQAKVGDTMSIASAENLLTSLAADRGAGAFAGPGGFWR